MECKLYSSVQLSIPREHGQTIKKAISFSSFNLLFSTTPFRNFPSCICRPSSQHAPFLVFFGVQNVYQAIARSGSGGGGGGSGAAAPPQPLWIGAHHGNIWGLFRSLKWVQLSPPFPLGLKGTSLPALATSAFLGVQGVEEAPEPLLPSPAKLHGGWTQLGTRTAARAWWEKSFHLLAQSPENRHGEGEPSTHPPHYCCSVPIPSPHAAQLWQVLPLSPGTERKSQWAWGRRLGARRCRHPSNMGSAPRTSL